MTSIPSTQRLGAPHEKSLEQKFCRLATTWRKAVAHHSSSRIRENHPAYQEIISLGEPVVPRLLRGA